MKFFKKGKWKSSINEDRWLKVFLKNILILCPSFWAYREVIITCATPHPIKLQKLLIPRHVWSDKQWTSVDGGNSTEISGALWERKSKHRGTDKRLMAKNPREVVFIGHMFLFAAMDGPISHLSSFAHNSSYNHILCTNI